MVKPSRIERLERAAGMVAATGDCPECGGPVLTDGRADRSKPGSKAAFLVEFVGEPPRRTRGACSRCGRGGVYELRFDSSDAEGAEAEAAGGVR